jgi:phosphoglycolate phosphatase-like HAD superfamily hydrolase
MVVAVDLDGTLCEYHEGAPAEIGDVMPGMIDELKKLKEAGWWICIWTVRPASLDLALQLEAMGAPFDEINANKYGPKDGSNKIYADVYLDDKAFQFMGDTTGLADKIMKFQAWHKAPPFEPKEQ